MSYMAIERESSEEEDNSSGVNLMSVAHGTGSTNNKKKKRSQRDDEGQSSEWEKYR